MTRESIFDDLSRDDFSYAKHSESTFAFLNRVAGAYWAQARDLVQEWANHVPSDNDYLQLREALRSKSDEQFRSAFFETYLHETFIRAGYRVEIHPTIPGTKRHPDFLVRREDDEFYVEAIVPGSRPAAAAATNREAVVIDILNAVPSPNFSLVLRDFESGPRPLNTRAFRKKLTNWLASLDPDHKFDPSQGPVFTWSDDEWLITSRAVAKGKEHRGKGGRTIAVYAATGGVVRDAEILKAAVESKASAYGELQLPFVVAVGTYFSGSFPREIERASYGVEGFRMDTDGQDDGYFGSAPPWRHHRVSGVLVVNQLMPYSVHKAYSTLWRHPSPARPLADKLNLPFAEMVPSGEGLAEVPPTTVASTHFGLPDEWPVGKPWA